MSDSGNFLENLGRTAGEMLERFFGADSMPGVFVPHTDDSGNTVITAATYERAGGFGWGGGAGSASGGDEGEGGGGGGGGMTQGRPVAVIRMVGDRVEVTPVLDVTKIAVTFLVSAAAVWRALR